ncbi:MAG: ABC transporter substrate-binding protein, partial [bacterium]|nr:ABC transporter substrate-binding protein [bacterium]
KGKIIGTGGSTENVAVKAVVKHFGLDPEKDITILAIGPGMKIPGIIAGSVDAVNCTIDEKIILKKKGFTDLFRISDIVGALTYGLGTTEKFIKEKRDHVRRMVKATLKGLIYTKENKAPVVEFVIKEWGYDKETANEGYDEHIVYFTRDGTVDEETIKYLVEDGKLLGYKMNPLIPPSQTIDFSFIKEVKQELGLTS